MEQVGKIDTGGLALEEFVNRAAGLAGLAASISQHADVKISRIWGSQPSPAVEVAKPSDTLSAKLAASFDEIKSYLDAIDVTLNRL